jgi:hypothetical protein
MRPSSNTRLRKRGLSIRSSGCCWKCAWQSFEDAGERVGDVGQAGRSFHRTRRVVTSYLLDRLPFRADLPGTTGNLAHLGNDKDFSSTRISYKLNLTGQASTCRLPARRRWSPRTSPARRFSQANATWRWREPPPYACPSASAIPA